MKPILVNLGCGSRFHADWLNYDLHSAAPSVQECDLSRGVPLPADSCDAVFNSALLEHLQPPEAAFFLGECRRILKPGGIFRLGVPDLEGIARIYLHQLERAVAGEPGANQDYDWILLELLDQMVRQQSGGRMAAFIQAGAPNAGFIQGRIGHEFTDLQAALQMNKQGAWQRLQALPAQERRHKLFQRLRATPGMLRRALGGMFLSAADRRALREGRFRRSGEVHQWMYDRYSLSRLLTNCGFTQVSVRAPGESAIPAWRSYQLDVDGQDNPIKPDLLYVECRK
jgi:SAM-dependent methyltransferase